MNTTPRLDSWSLRTRVSLLLTALAGVLVVALAGLWLRQTQESVREEVAAATRVAEQWLRVTARARGAGPQDDARLLADIRALGRIRANALEVLDGAGQRRYLSPPSRYKAGRAAPAWFGAAVEPRFAARRIAAGELTLVLRPDASRATLDAWDELCAMAGWAVAMLAALFLAACYALDRALRPLGQVMAALDRTGQGRFDTRLPVFPERELGGLANAFNHMADRLAEAVNDNVRLESGQLLADRLALQMEQERRAIARELHDELAQGITAVRALAGAIAQRSAEQPALHGHAHSIVAVTGQMQDGVRAILQRLRAHDADADGGADEAVRRYLAVWQQHYPDIALDVALAAGPAPAGAELTQAILRLVQEGLTNVARHAGATRVEVALRRLQLGADGWFELTLADNGCGLGAATPSVRGFGLAGMRERVAALAGELLLDGAAGGGTRLRVRLPASRAGVPEGA